MVKLLGACDGTVGALLVMQLIPYYAVSITGYGTAPTVYSTNIVKNNILTGQIRPVYFILLVQLEQQMKYPTNTFLQLVVQMEQQLIQLCGIPEQHLILRNNRDSNTCC